MMKILNNWIVATVLSIAILIALIGGVILLSRYFANTSAGDCYELIENVAYVDRSVVPLAKSILADDFISVRECIVFKGIYDRNEKQEKIDALKEKLK